MRLRDTDERTRRLRQVMELMDEQTKSAAIDKALIHYLEDHRNKQKLLTELPADQLEHLSTAAMPIDITISMPDDD